MARTTHGDTVRGQAAGAAAARFAMPASSREEIRAGILYMIGAVFLFSVANALVKWQVARYPVGEVIFFRCAFSLVPCLILVATHGGLKILRTNRIRDHVGRAVTQFIGMGSFFIALSMMPLADAVAITFSSPLFLTVLSIAILGEQVGRYRWSAVVVGFLGVLVMARPGGGAIGLGALFALVNAALSASVTIALRRMSLTETSTTLVTYQLLVNAALATVLLLPLGWVTPSRPDLLGLIAIGLCSGTAQYLWTQAFRFAPAAIAAPFSYTQMVWAIGFGFMLWGDVPTTGLLAGSAIVVASGLYILYRETIRGASKVTGSARR
jgi:drug/metabolite transporter (DMT)-like permease